ncbi:peptidoglycan-binding protein [Pontibacillus halophilus JSM 076056 = DSM 19796]|uniref:Peptidoglycan-binding protein n=1 Tax=Pontibacillus halophilus JSM 076056 = DSM 19796 TaxID=1385510 RepID=A0A0A5GGK6_9BACI|nr:3D domain-containing protein [Pontibacillus halophilus]KGX90250.1 peptidoglycan-binding protein [Pontibacillus halophilus JSM 076056 = DSM 19796]
MKKTLVSLAAIATFSFGTAATASAAEVTVKSGDTLWGISQDYGVSVQQIKDMNGLSGHIIYPNQRLTVGGEGNQASTSAQSSSNGSHTVKSGDTLWGIATANGLSVSQLKGMNGLTSDIIHPGQQLSLQGEANNTTTTTTTTTVETTTTTTTETTTSKVEQNQSNQAESNDVAKTLTVNATAYTANCQGCSGVTSTGIDLKANPDRKVIAVDPNVIPLGSEVYVEGYGKAIAGDIGGAIKGNKIDVFIPNRSDALNWGNKTVEVTVYK